MSCIVIYERMVKLDLIVSFCYIKFFGAIDVGTGLGVGGGWGVRSPPLLFSNLNIYVTITIILISLVNVSNTSSPPLSLCFRRHWEQYTYTCTYILVLTDIFHLPFHLLSLDMKSIGTSLARCLCTHFRKSFFFLLFIIVKPNLQWNILMYILSPTELR